MAKQITGKEMVDLIDWSDPLLCQMPEPIAGIDMGVYQIPLIPVPRIPLWTGFCNKNVEGYILGSFAVKPNGKRTPAELMFEKAMESGCLKPGGIAVDTTSGSMGAAEAFVAKRYGVTVHTVIADDMPYGKVLPQVRLGAVIKRESELVEYLGLDKSPGLIKLAELYAAKIGAFFLNQYTNQWNPASWAIVAEVLYEIFGESLTEAFIDLGSTGCLRGMGKRLKELNPNIQIIGARPYFKRKIGGLRGPERLRELEGWEGIADDIEGIDERTAREYSKEAFSLAGIPLGESGGTGLARADHWYGELAGNDRLNERHVGIVRGMDTFVPYSLNT
jgi:cysteine synthase